MFKAKTIMTKGVLTVTEQTPAYEAMRMLVENNITGLPVVSPEGDLAGMVTEKDMLGLLYNPGQEPATVGQMMSRDVVSFDENADLADVCECLIDHSFRRVPILANGKLAGIVSRSDIIKFILSARKGKAGA